MLNFGLVSAAGYIEPRHMLAIKATGRHLVAALGPADSVGVIDDYFPQNSFFTEFERVDRHVDKLRRLDGDQRVDYISMCSPNYLHYLAYPVRASVRRARHLREAARAQSVELRRAVRDGERDRTHVFTILQLRAHPAITALKAQVAAQAAGALSMRSISPRKC